LPVDDLDRQATGVIGLDRVRQLKQFLLCGPTPLNNATLTNVSMLATDAADARGRILAIAVMLSSKAQLPATAL
jgi:hypothetical protein